MAVVGRKPKVRKPFEEEKDEVLEKVILHMLHPDQFAAPLLTHEEIATLWAKDEGDRMTKMAICKTEQRALKHLREGLAKIGITKFEDVFGVTANAKAAADMGVNL